jgi:predicted nucleic acid-binding protein
MAGNYFMDSSALVKHFIDENGSEAVCRIVENEKIIISRLTQVEVISAIARWSRKQSPMLDINALIEAFQYFVTERFNIVEINPKPALEIAVRIAKHHGLRAADSIQLACALIAKQSIGSDPFTLVSCDRELNSAAQIEGIAVENPDLPRQP